MNTETQNTINAIKANPRIGDSLLLPCGSLCPNVRHWFVVDYVTDVSIGYSYVDQTNQHHYCTYTGVLTEDWPDLVKRAYGWRRGT